MPKQQESSVPEAWESYVPGELLSIAQQAFAKRGGCLETSLPIPSSSVFCTILDGEKNGAVNSLDERVVIKIVMETLTMAFNFSKIRMDKDVDDFLSETTDEILDTFLKSITVRAAPGHPRFEGARLRRKLARAVFLELRDSWSGRDWVCHEAFAVIAWLHKRSDTRHKASYREASEATLLESSRSICETISRVLVDPIVKSTFTDRPKPANMFNLGTALVSHHENRPMLEVIDSHASLCKKPINPGRVKELEERVEKGEEILSGGGSRDEQRRRGARLFERVASLGLAAFNVVPRLVRAGTQRMEIPSNANDSWRNLAMKLESAMAIVNRHSPGQSSTETALRRAADRSIGFSLLTRMAAADLEAAKVLHQGDQNSTFDFDNNNRNLNMKEAAMGRLAMVRCCGVPVFRRAREVDVALVVTATETRTHGAPRKNRFRWQHRQCTIAGNDEASTVAL